jgi:hypothetical protein
MSVGAVDTARLDVGVWGEGVSVGDFPSMKASGLLALLQR